MTPRRLSRMQVAGVLTAMLLGVAGCIGWLTGPPVPRPVPTSTRLPFDVLLQRVQAAEPQRTIESISWWSEPGKADEVRWADGWPRRAAIDPASGRPLEPRIADVLRDAVATLPTQTLLGAAVLLLLLAALRTWRGAGRRQRAALLCLLLALLPHAAASLATWTLPGRPQGVPIVPPADLMARLDQAVDHDHGQATLQPQATPDAPLHLEVSGAGGGVVELDAKSGELLQRVRHDDLPLASRWREDAMAWRDDGAFGGGLTSLLNLLLPWLAFVALRPRARLAPAAASATSPLLIAYASQSGTAAELARDSALALREGGVHAVVEDIARLSQQALTGIERALFIVATTGNGEPPDHARRFAAGLQGADAALPGLQYGLLALGDRRYQQFCGFGRQLGAWLQQSGASAIFPRIEVDSGDRAALAQWQTQLQALGAAAGAPSETGWGRWRLVERRCLNPGSVGLPCFHLELAPVDASQAAWQAGDIAEIRCGGDEIRRDYSIASLPADGRLHVLIRQVRQPDGRPGVGSFWLTAELGLGAEIRLRIRPNAAFHAPPPGTPLLLIGNGTGLAGLRAHLRQRVRDGERRNWLIFGERERAHDRHHGDEIDAWHGEGWLERLDLVFSRDTPQHEYVQHRLQAAGDEARRWIDDGAAVYVCGSRDGMAPAVDAVLRGLIGDDALLALGDSGRYRRDIY